ncbi:hypothetical protein [Weissella soli]|nr:hypothetical protein [Weissella soli]
MQPDLNSVITTLLQEHANLALKMAQYKSLVEQYQQAQQAEKAKEN